jgi:hypothetical protein
MEDYIIPFFIGIFCGILIGAIFATITCHHIAVAHGSGTYVEDGDNINFMWRTNASQ